MFDFQDKTISELQNEIAVRLGQKIITRNKETVIINKVTECGERHITNLSGNFQFMRHNGEVDLNKALVDVKMYGFAVEIMQQEDSGKCSTQWEQIIVPYDSKDKKMTVRNNSPMSVLK